MKTFLVSFIFSLSVLFFSCGNQFDDSFEEIADENISFKYATVGTNQTMTIDYPLAIASELNFAMKAKQFVNMAIHEFDSNGNPKCLYQAYEYNTLKPKVLRFADLPIKIDICKPGYMSEVKVYANKSGGAAQLIGTIPANVNEQVIELWLPFNQDIPDGFYTISYKSKSGLITGAQSFIYQKEWLDDNIIPAGEITSIKQSIIDDKFDDPQFTTRTNKSLAHYVFKKINTFEPLKYLQDNSWPAPDDEDFDDDGINDDEDNCPEAYNPGQEDTDNDEIGNVCDICNNDTNPTPCGCESWGAIDPNDPNHILGDFDGDGVCDNFDNCVNDFNPGQYDEDDNDIGNSCDDDYEASSDPCMGIPDSAKPMCKKCSHSRTGEKLTHLCKAEDGNGIFSYGLDVNITDIENFGIKGNLHLKKAILRGGDNDSTGDDKVVNQFRFKIEDGTVIKPKIRIDASYGFGCIEIPMLFGGSVCLSVSALYANFPIPDQWSAPIELTPTIYLHGDIIGTIENTGVGIPHITFKSSVKVDDVFLDLGNGPYLLNFVLGMASGLIDTVLDVFGFNTDLTDIFESIIAKSVEKSINAPIKKALVKTIQKEITEFLQKAHDKPIFTTNVFYSNYPSRTGLKTFNANINATSAKITDSDGLNDTIEDMEMEGDDDPIDNILQQKFNLRIVQSMGTSAPIFHSIVGFRLPTSEENIIRELPDKNFATMFRHWATNVFLNRLLKAGIFYLPINNPQPLTVTAGLFGNREYTITSKYISLQNPPIMYFNGDTSKPRNFLGVSHILYKAKLTRKILPSTTKSWDIAFLLSLNDKEIFLQETNGRLKVLGSSENYFNSSNIACDLIQKTGEIDADLMLQTFCQVAIQATSRLTYLPFLNSLHSNILNKIDFNLSSYKLNDIVRIPEHFQQYFSNTTIFPNTTKLGFACQANTAAYYPTISIIPNLDYGLYTNCQAGFAP